MGDQPLQFLPETLGDANEPLRIYDRLEIVALLRALQRGHTLVTAYFDQCRQFWVTNVLDVNPDFEELVLDTGHESAAHELILRSSPIIFVAFVDRIKIQFEAERAETTAFDDRPALRVRLPEWILRLQRREDYRAPAPVAVPPLCHIPIPNRPGETEAVRIANISRGGVSIVSRSELLILEPEIVLPECRIELPNTTTIDVSLYICHVKDYLDSANRSVKRCGCRFVDLPGPDSTQVQRYINIVERERHKAIE